MIRDALPKRARDAQTGDFGHVLIIGGDYGMLGAVKMAAMACARVGAGLTTVATRVGYAGLIASSTPEVMAHAIDKTATLKKLLKKATVIVIGPGLGQEAWSRQLLELALACDLPKVIDADALNLLSTQLYIGNRPRSLVGQYILTPHPGEAARLLKSKPEAIQADRLAALQALQAKWGGICVLKGAKTLIQGADAAVYACPVGNPGMATGGMGDVLSGVIGGLLAQGLSLEAAACVGVYVHGQAGDLAAQAGGERGMVATDLLPFLRQLVNP
jgi:NAD(P)H-hydrate epimerase